MSTEELLQQFEAELQALAKASYAQQVAEIPVKVTKMRAKLECSRQVVVMPSVSKSKKPEGMIPEDEEFCSLEFRSPIEVIEYLELDWSAGYFRKQLSAGKIPGRKAGRSWEVQTAWAFQEKLKKVFEDDNEKHKRP